jgi:peptidoglycan/LPS O-acetylase OafA/YrhL
MQKQVYQSTQIQSHGISKWEPRPLGAAASAHLDLIRAVAAWAVMWGHLRNVFFVDFKYVQHSNPLIKVMYFLTGFGHQSVVIFFVLSGFLISSAVIRRQVSETWSWLSYGVDRLSRLYVVLIPGLLFGLLFDKAGASLFASTGLYTHSLDGFGSAIAQNRATLGTFLGNLFFLQTIICPTFGSNGPLWSLANEFWYYVLFPVTLSAGLAWSNKFFRRAILFAILAVLLAVFLRSAILIGFLVWMAGYALVIAYSRFRLTGRSWLTLYVVTTSLALSVCLEVARVGGSVALGSDLVLGTAFSLFLFGILQMEFGTQHVHYSHATHLLAGFSYSLYVLHFPLLLFFRAWWAPSHRWQPDMTHLFYGAIVGAISLGFAWLVSVFTEKQTHFVRDWMAHLFRRLSRPPVPVEYAVVRDLRTTAQQRIRS